MKVRRHAADAALLVKGHEIVVLHKPSAGNPELQICLRLWRKGTEVFSISASSREPLKGQKFAGWEGRFTPAQDSQS